MSVGLRPHHLLCLLTYVGKGYSPGFVANMTALAERLNAGERVEIVAGPDAVCAPLLAEDPACHCHNTSVIARDHAAARDLEALLGHPLAPGATLTLDADRVAALRDSFAKGTTRTACIECQWFALCTDVAQSGYAGAHLAP